MPGPASPPAIARSILARLIPEVDRDAVLQELDELFQIRCARHGHAAGRRWYRRQVAVFAAHLARHGRARGVPHGVGEGRSALERSTTTTETGGWEMGSMRREIRGAVRRLVRAPVFTTVAGLTIAVGIGAFASIYALVDAVLLEPVPYDDPDDLVWVWRDYVEADFPRGWLGGPDVVGLRAQDEVFEDVVALRSGSVNLATGDGTDPQRIDVQLVTHELLGMLGVSPLLGRDFRPEDELEGAPAVAILAHDFWTSRFGADPSVIGRTVTVDGASAEIVGVAPERFRFVKHASLSEPVRADAYLSLQQDLAAASPGSGAYAGLARIRAGTPGDRVQAALAAAGEETNVWFAERGASTVRLWAVELQEDLVAPVRPALTALLASAGLLLLILAANLATLLLGRAAGRAHELGVRVALGAGRGRLLSSVVGESLVLAALGGTLGIVLAVAGTELVVALAPADLPRLAGVQVDGSVVAVAAAVTALMALVAGVAPSLGALRADVAATLKDADARGGGSLGRTRLRSVLVAAQMAISVMLLAGAGLTARAFAELLGADPGFDAGETITFAVPLSGATYPDDPTQLQFHEELRRRLAALAGVRTVGATTALPLTQLTDQSGIQFPLAPGNVGDPQADGPLVDLFRVTPGYFEAAGLRLLQGRGIQEIDADTATYSIVIDDVLASRFFPDGSAVGSRAFFIGDTATVVGVVDQARLYGVAEDDRGQVYVPNALLPSEELSYAVRGDLDAISLVPAVRGVIRELDASIPLADVRTLRDLVDASLAQQRLSLTLILAFALGSLLLASLGIYGVVANAVVRRRQEIGVRIAFGASGGEVLRLVVGQGVRLAAVGAALGLVGAAGMSGVAERLVGGVDAGDPLVYVLVTGALVGVAALASWLPARRATRIDPVEALRAR